MYLHRHVTAALGLAGGILACGPSHAALLLTPAGIADNFTLTTYFSDPPANYGLLSATTTAGGQVLATGFASDTLNLLSDVDGQTPASILQSVSVASVGQAYSVATANGVSYFATGQSGGGSPGYYVVNTSNLSLTKLTLNTAVTPQLGLWANPVTGHLLSSTFSGLVDIDPTTGNVHVITSTTTFDGVTVSPDGKTAYAYHIGTGDILAYDIASGTLLKTLASDASHSPDGTGVITGTTFNGDLIVNNNDGTVALLDPNTDTTTIIASGGTRGDFVGPDFTNGTLFLASADAEERLGLAGGTIGGGTAAPEPATLGVLGLGMVALAAVRRRRRR